MKKRFSGIPDNQVAGLPDEQEEKAEPIKLPIALRRIHDKLRDPTELYKLHLKHHHMSLSQFKKRTSALQIPKDIYEAYGELVKKCETCQTVKSAPSRAKTSGLRSDTFGDLTFVDHGEITLPSGLEKTYVHHLLRWCNKPCDRTSGRKPNDRNLSSHR